MAAFKAQIVFQCGDLLLQLFVFDPELLNGLVNDWGYDLTLG